jgi:anthranilate synthase/aminodeoxychorismate synthase-like glutamine amidotransferase
VALPQDPAALYGSLWQGQPYSFLLDSAAPPGRWSFLGGDPLVVLAAWGDQVGLWWSREPQPVWTRRSPWTAFQELVDRLRSAVEPPALGAAPSMATASDSAPPWPWCLALLGYELATFLEDVPARSVDRPALPDLLVVVPQTMWALERHGGAGAWWRCRLTPRQPTLISSGVPDEAAVAQGGRLGTSSRALVAGPGQDAPREAPLAAAPYRQRVVQAQGHILAGTAFELCVTGQWSAPCPGSPFELFRELRARTPEPYAAFVQLPTAAVVSASPEQFLHIDPSGCITTRPIKGTRPRGATPDEDGRLAQELRTSVKDRAENLMIADLARSDLGRVCAVGSVHTPALCELEAHPAVWQLVSTVRGQLRPGVESIVAVAAAFPPGSMVGAPKVQAMRLLAELEPTRRGLYAGALGRVGLDGSVDLSVVIRTAVVERGVAYVHVGGAVVSDSEPEAEYVEAQVKGRALAQALASVVGRAEPVAAPPTVADPGGLFAQRPLGGAGQGAAPQRGPGHRGPASGIRLRSAGGGPRRGSVLLIDNYDSFTFNLAQLVAEQGVEVEVVRNDGLDLQRIAELAPDHIVISPGPGDPADAAWLGVAGTLLEAWKHGTPPVAAPVLGVCLGHQALAHRFGATVVRSPAPVHGKPAVVRKVAGGGRLLAALPERFDAMRYHSLVVDDATLPKELRLTASSDDGLAMAIEHRRWPLYGVQFHPESLGTPLGGLILKAFLAVAPLPSATTGSSR